MFLSLFFQPNIYFIPSSPQLYFFILFVIIIIIVLRAITLIIVSDKN